MHFNAISSAIIILIILWKNSSLFDVIREISGKAFIKLNLNSMKLWKFSIVNSMSPTFYSWKNIPVLSIFLYSYFQFFFSKTRWFQFRMKIKYA
jgi:hypothetical protein